MWGPDNPWYKKFSQLKFPNILTGTMHLPGPNWRGGIALYGCTKHAAIPSAIGRFKVKNGIVQGDVEIVRTLDEKVLTEVVESWEKMKK